MTIDTISSNEFINAIASIKGELENSKDPKTLFETIVQNLWRLNTTHIKSLILYYYHDLENRTSYSQRDEDEFIKYSHNNTHFDKIEILKHFSEITRNFIGIYKAQYAGNEEVAQFIQFLYYLDSKYFLDVLTFLIVSCFDEVLLIKYDKDNVVLKEIKIFKSCIGM
jgi:hypothetical protein